MTHGGDIYSREIELDFSANINPLGMPRGAVEALRENVRAFECYPDPYCSALRVALAEKEGVGRENIVCSNGAADMIYRVAKILSPKRTLVTAPSFSEYEKAFKEAGCETERFYLSEKDDFKIGIGILEHIPPFGAVFLASPNNPDGGMTDTDTLKKIIAKCREVKTLLILDECFADFSEKSADLPKAPVIIKAFTKIYAMAGLRLGYAVCADASFAKRLFECGPCWSVSTPAQTAALAALKEEGYIEKTRLLIKNERGFLSDKLKALGLKVFPSEANFILFKGPEGLDEKLLLKKIAIRRCSDYHGLGKNFYRTAVRMRSENEHLLQAMEEILKGGE